MSSLKPPHGDGNLGLQFGGRHIEIITGPSILMVIARLGDAGAGR
jgi:hypothetical protein